jgi:Uma2 family endonuclease
MSTALEQEMTVDQFLRWAEGKDGRWELQDGVPAMMSPERLAHIRTKFSAA